MSIQGLLMLYTWGHKNILLPCAASFDSELSLSLPTCEAGVVIVHVGGVVVLDALFPVGVEGNQGGMQTGHPAQLWVGTALTVPSCTAASNVSSVITVSDTWT